MATSLNELMRGFKNSFLFKGKTARRIVGKKKNSLMESLAIPVRSGNGNSKNKDEKEGAFFAGSREWSDGKAEWYEICPPLKHRMPDGSIQEFDHVLIAHVDGKTMAYGSYSEGYVADYSQRELYSEKGDVSNEKVLDILGYSFEGDAEIVKMTKETGLKSSEKYEKYEDGEDEDDDEDEDSETPEGETGTPEPHETKTPEAEETGSPEPEEDDDEDDDEDDED